MWRRVAVVLFLANAAVAAADSTTQARFDAFGHVIDDVWKRPQIEQAPRVRRAFDLNLSPLYANTRTASDEELRRLLQAAGMLGFYQASRADLSLIQTTLRELERRIKATNADRRIYFEGLVRLRMFDEARAFRARHPAMEVEDVPMVVDEAIGAIGSIVYVVDAHAIVRRQQPMDGTRLIVVSSPFCAFSREAMATLSRDLQLADILRHRTTWIAPVDRRLDLAQLRTWNNENPATPILMTGRREDWPFAALWSTPTFYVVKDGKLIGFFEGWPKGVGRRPQLVALLRAAGLEVR